MTVATMSPWLANGGVDIAEVVQVYPEGHKLLVRAAPADASELISVESVTAETRSARVGDRVVITSASSGEYLAIGILMGNRSAPAVVPEVRLHDGSHACAPDGPEGRRLQVYSNRNELLFEYDAQTQTLRLNNPSGDIELNAPAGDIRLQAGERVSLAGQVVDAAGSRQASLSIVDGRGQTRSTLRLEGQDAKLAGATLAITGDALNVTSATTHYQTQRLQATMAEATVVTRVLRCAAKTLETTARHVYHTVERLLQVRAGRTRTIVSETHQLKAHFIDIRAENDVQVDGERIRLG